jgi:hypothetical protein
VVTDDAGGSLTEAGRATTWLAISEKSRSRAASKLDPRASRAADALRISGEP